MSNRTFVCFNCRTTERVPIYRRLTRNCRKCRGQAEHVYYKFKIPKRDDTRGWRELEGKVRVFNRAEKNRELPRLRQEQTQLERLLAETPQTRQTRLKALRTKLKVIKGKIEEWNLWP